MIEFTQAADAFIWLGAVSDHIAEALYFFETASILEHRFECSEVGVDV